MDFKGTKGDWQHCGSNGCKTIFVKGSKGQRRKEICDTVGRGEIEDLANAQLIIKAPEMLQAMQEFCDRVDCGEVRSKRTYAKFKKLIEEATSL